MKVVYEPQKYFTVSEFEDGWGMQEVECEEQLFLYCTEVLFIPEENIEELSINDNYNLEIYIKDLEYEDTEEDWYVNLLKISKDVK